MLRIQLCNFKLLKCIFVLLFSDLGQKLFDLFTTYPDFAKIWLGKDLSYLVTKPQYIEIILNSPHALEKMEAYDYTSIIIGKGLLTGPGKVLVICT